MPPIPILLLTGYLGSGKTTLLNHLLGLPEVAGRAPVLLVNEFGTLGVDAQHLRALLNHRAIDSGCEGLVLPFLHD